MARQCRLPGCTEDALGPDAPAGVRGRFCSAQCDVTYDHLKADARAAERAAAEGY